MPNWSIAFQQRTAEVRVASLYARSLIEASLDPLVTISAEGKITDVNDASVQATGLSREQLIGTDFCDYFTEPEKARAGYEQVFREGSVRDYALELRHRDGQVTSILYNASVYRDESGKTVGVFAAARDITKRKRAEAAVQTERQRFLDVLETLPVIIVLLRPDHRVEWVNRAYRGRWATTWASSAMRASSGTTSPATSAKPSLRSRRTSRTTGNGCSQTAGRLTSTTFRSPTWTVRR